MQGGESQSGAGWTDLGHARSPGTQVLAGRRGGSFVRGPHCPVAPAGGGGSSWAAPPALPELALSGSRLQPWRLLLNHLCRLKTATVPELTPGDPESCPPTPQALSVLSVCWTLGRLLRGPRLQYLRPGRPWGAGARSSPPQPGGLDREPLLLYGPSPPAPLPVGEWGGRKRGKEEEREAVLRGLEGVPPPQFLWLR